MDEFELIQTYFKALSKNSPQILLGIGDDAACVSISPDEHILISMDTLVSHVHFLPDWNPFDIAYRAVMVNVSDIAAMGGVPRWITLALTLPDINKKWLSAFSKGLSAALDAFDMALIGGDITAGPLSITVGIHGIVPKNQAITRSKACPGDTIWVSGQLGAAALALSLLNNEDVKKRDKEVIMERLFAPQPRVELGILLRDSATAALDISDGLASDLRHICEASQVGATLNAIDIPIHPLVKKYAVDDALELALTGGDDYELCFTIPFAKTKTFFEIIKETDHTCRQVGVIEAEKGLRVKGIDNQVDLLSLRGYRHFK